MRKPWLAALAAASTLICAPSAAQDNAAPSAMVDNRQVSDWLLSVSDALEVGAQGLAKLSEVKPLMDGIQTRAQLAQVLPRIRALLAEARQTVRRSEAMLAAVAPLDLAVAPNLTADRVIAEARGQAEATVTVLNDLDSMLVAMEAGDAAKVEKLFPSVARGSFLLLESNSLILRNRQAGIGKDNSNHQAIGIAVQMYRAMAEAGRAWVTASLEKRPQEAAARLREQLVSVARESRALALAGRANLARELAEIDRVLDGAPASEGRDMLARTRRLVAGEEQVFALGEELARLVEAHSATNGAELGAQTRPELLGMLVPIEARFQALTQAQAREAGQAIR